MPTRLVDGEALWKSSKLRKVSRKFRGEYANLIPLAEANGSFDADPVKIWVDVYAFNREDMTPDNVVQLLDEFEKAGMLVRWTQESKTWGHWVGIGKPGRLPPVAHRKRYKSLPPEPPAGLIRDNPGQLPESPGLVPEDSGQVPEGLGLGLGLGLDWYGMGLEEKQVATRKQFRNVVLRAGLVPDSPTSPSWRTLDEMIEAFEGTDVLELFEGWLGEKTGEEVKYPISLFVRVLPSLVQAPGLKKPDKDLDTLAKKLYKIGGAMFTGKSLRGLGELRSKFSDKEIEQAWQMFVNDEQGSYQSNWPKKFVEGAGRLLADSIRDENTRREKMERGAEVERAKRRSEVEAEIAASEAQALQDERELQEWVEGLDKERQSL